LHIIFFARTSKPNANFNSLLLNHFLMHSYQFLAWQFISLWLDTLYLEDTSHECPYHPHASLHWAKVCSLCFGTIFLSYDTHILHYVITFFYAFSQFNSMKKMKKNNKIIIKKGGEAYIFFIGKSLIYLEKSIIFEWVSQYFVFSMDLGDFFSFLSIISSSWLFFQPYGAFVYTSCITIVS